MVTYFSSTTLKFKIAFLISYIAFLSHKNIMEKCLVNHNHFVVTGLKHNEQISSFRDGQSPLIAKLFGGSFYHHLNMKLSFNGAKRNVQTLTDKK